MGCERLRIIYVVPFTTIIDQNVRVLREILEPESENNFPIILEHHSNLLPEEETWKSKLLSENWNVPIVFTTSVHFLEVLFSGGTRSARKMHQLANSVIIFDEIQTLPIKCVHMFNNSINFLVETCGSSVVLCTATQPLLNEVDPGKGACDFSNESEIVPDVNALFNTLRRVEVIDSRKTGGYSNEEIAACAIEEMVRFKSCLVIVNTKKSASDIYKILSEKTAEMVFHLSTDMCPAHRIAVLDKVRNALDENVPVLCISTQLIEAGIDIDFGAVIRFIAGVDSVAQAAGRCNRNGFREVGYVKIINSKEEALTKLPDIVKGIDAAERVLHEMIHDPDLRNRDLLSPDVLERYFTYYFFNRKYEMDYSVPADTKNGPERKETLLNLLADNPITLTEYFRVNNKLPEDVCMNHSFSTAGKIFKVIDAPTRGIIVPFNSTGKEIINDLCSVSDIEKQYRLISEAQRYSVNVYPWRFELLEKKHALNEVQKGSGIYYLDERYYDNNSGLSDEPGNLLETLIL